MKNLIVRDRTSHNLGDPGRNNVNNENVEGSGGGKTTSGCSRSGLEYSRSGLEYSRSGLEYSGLRMRDEEKAESSVSRRRSGTFEKAESSWSGKCGKSGSSEIREWKE